MRKYFKRIGDKLAFNSMDAEPIFLIIEEKENGYIYFQESKPFGELMFVLKNLVEEEEVQEEATEEPPKTGKKNG